MKTTILISAIASFFPWIIVFVVNFFIEPSPQSTHYVAPIKSTEVSKKITSTFGETRTDHFHNGLDFSSVNEKVLAIKNGKLLFSYFNGDDPYREELGSGNFVWLDHGNGESSTYFHLRDEKEFKLKLEVKQGETVGFTGNTGHSSGAHLHFIHSIKFGSLLQNPILLFPEIVDTNPPEIFNLNIHAKSGSFTRVMDGDTIKFTKTFPVTVQIIDKSESIQTRTGIYQAKFFLNGKLIKEFKLNQLIYKNSKWQTSNRYGFEEIYYEDEYLIGYLNLKGGVNEVKIFAADYFNNTSEKKFTFFVNKI